MSSSERTMASPVHLAAVNEDPQPAAPRPARDPATIKPSREIADLLAVMAALRTPGSGCPWDLEQSFATIAPYTIEEAYEVADAIDRGDMQDLKEELGDLLLQVVFHSQMAEEAHQFNFGDVVEIVTQKLIRRHPHVFGDKRGLDPEAVKKLWKEIKASERAARPDAAEAGVLDGVPVNLPPVMRAQKLQDRAATVGFDWKEPQPVLAKIIEEVEEISEAMQAEAEQPKLQAEVGDLLFAVINLARHLKIDASRALAETNGKFQRRFSYIEQELAAQCTSPAEATLERMEALWNEAKELEKATK